MIKTRIIVGLSSSVCKKIAEENSSGSAVVNDDNSKTKTYIYLKKSKHLISHKNKISTYLEQPEKL